MTTDTLMLRMTGVRARYGSALALSDLNLSVAAGSVLAVLGPNGAGKSTIARVVSGLVPVVSGEITFDGQPITGWQPDRIRRAGLVHLPEGRGVFTGLTVSENLRLATATLPRPERKTAAERAYEIFDVLGKRRRQVAGTMSGGEQQMLSLARALVLNPALIIADELSLGLAPLMVDMVFESLRRAREEGVTIILIEQFIHRALALADQCVVISRGSVVWKGPAADAGGEVLQRYLGTAAA